MITGTAAVQAFVDSGVALFVGVPDSLMKGFCGALESLPQGARHVPAPNEGSAVGIAAGEYLATGNPALVYMQNSGLGNAINPLTSLTSGDVYGIPMVLLVGWRGQPGVSDEPQHRAQGAITLEELKLLDITTRVVGPNTSGLPEVLRRASGDAKETGSPVAIVVEKGTFSSLELERQTAAGISRIEGLRTIVRHLPTTTAFVASTGYTGRELAGVREELEGETVSDFLVIGSMGHASSIALGIALASEDRLVCCLDGDGALAMHLGSMAAVGEARPSNLLHIVFNNRVHESVGGLPTVIGSADIPGVAKALGYKSATRCPDLSALEDVLDRLDGLGPALIEIETAPGTLPGLPRPDNLDKRKRRFMEQLKVD